MRTTNRTFKRDGLWAFWRISEKVSCLHPIHTYGTLEKQAVVRGVEGGHTV